MSSYNVEFLPPSLADFQSIQASLPKNEQEGEESVYLTHGGRALKAEKISQKMKDLVIARSAVRQRTVPLMCAGTVWMQEWNGSYKAKPDTIIAKFPG